MTPVNQTKKRPGHKCGNHLAASIASMLDLKLEEVPLFEEMKTWQNQLYAFLGEKGWQLEINEDEAPAGYAIAWGFSKHEGMLQTVIVKDGKLVHDPHPDGAGLSTTNAYWSLIPYTPEEVTPLPQV